jgi:hypothetical protein
MSKKILVLILVCLLGTSFSFAQEPAVEQPEAFYVYLDKGARENHYIPSGWMGDYGDVKMDDQHLTDP